MNIKIIKCTLAKVFQILAEIIFPKHEKVRRLEVMSAAEILASIPGAEPVENAPHLHALFKYSHSLAKQIVWEIKYRGNEKLVAEIGKIMRVKILGMIGSSNNEEFILIPIPSSTRHMKERGFNQTELIAMAINAENYFSFAPNILLKIKQSPSQRELGMRSERLKNLIGAYGVKNPKVISGKNIILIDDVITTGATMKEAERALSAAGAKSVSGFAIAH